MGTQETIGVLMALLAAWATREIVGLKQRRSDDDHAQQRAVAHPPERASGEWQLPPTRGELERVEKLARGNQEALAAHERACAERWRQAAQSSGRVEAQLEQLLSVIKSR